MDKDGANYIPLQLALEMPDQFADWGEPESLELQLRLFEAPREKESVCEHIIKHLGKNADVRAWILRGLNHRFATVRLQALKYARELADESTVPFLVERLKDRSKYVPAAAQAAIIACASQRIEYVQPLLDRLADASYYISAAFALRYPHFIREVHDACLGYLDIHRDDEWLSSLAGTALTFYTNSETVIGEMRMRLAEAGSELCALSVLGQIGTADDVRPYLAHSDVRYQRAAARDLMRHGLDQDKPALHALFDQLRSQGLLSVTPE